jgi:hypothetical protein
MPAGELVPVEPFDAIGVDFAADVNTGADDVNTA